ncbi:MAG: ferredoxin [bacterium]|nr:ferredoxin [bacterium]
MKKIIHDQSKCIGCLACVGLAPELFEVDPDTGLARLIGGVQNADGLMERSVPDEQAPEMLEAACCGGAIKVITE